MPCDKILIINTVEPPFLEIALNYAEMLKYERRIPTNLLVSYCLKNVDGNQVTIDSFRWLLSRYERTLKMCAKVLQ